MFERYTESARRMLFFARYECSQLGSTVMGTEHLLLGLVREHKGITARVLELARVSPEALRLAVEAEVPARARVPESVEIPFAEDTARVLRSAATEADQLRHGYIGTEHLLLGMLREEESFAARLLTRHGVTLAEARKTIAEIAGTGGDESPATPVISLTLISSVADLTHKLAEARPGSEETSSIVNQIHVALGRLRGLLGQ